MDVMLMGRELRRVPLDFDAPVGETWAPLLRPESLRPPVCAVCGPPTVALGNTYGGSGDGFSVWARQLHLTWFMSGFGAAPHHEWWDKLAQPEIDALWEEHHYLQRWFVTRPTPEEYRGRIGECREKMAFDTGDSMMHICAKARCAVLGVEEICSGCDGSGYGGSAESLEAWVKWEPPEVPSGPGFQLWQTVSEGGPCSPVFESVHKLAQWLSVNDDSSLRGRSMFEWLEILGGDVLGIDVQTGRLVK